MFSADSALAILHTCAPGELEEALRNRPEMIIRLRNVLDAFPPGPGIGTASQSSTTPQAAAATQASASTTTPQTFGQNCMVPGFGGAPIFLMAPGPPPRPASEAPPTQQATAITRPTICIRGRDVPHSTPQPEPRPSTPRFCRGMAHGPRRSHLARRGTALLPPKLVGPGELVGVLVGPRSQTHCIPTATALDFPTAKTAQRGTSPACRARQC